MRLVVFLQRWGNDTKRSLALGLFVSCVRILSVLHEDTYAVWMGRCVVWFDSLGLGLGGELQYYLLVVVCSRVDSVLLGGMVCVRVCLVSCVRCLFAFAVCVSERAKWMGVFYCCIEPLNRVASKQQRISCQFASNL